MKYLQKSFSLPVSDTVSQERWDEIFDNYLSFKGTTQLFPSNLNPRDYTPYVKILDGAIVPSKG